MKKCLTCSKSAVYHVTILHEGDVKELHFCEIHFHEYMNDSSSQEEDDPTPAELEADLFSGISLDEDTEEVEELQCPHCGITFSEFRKEGRFGCPQDYDVFREKLIPLFQNIHNATDHAGKVPAHGSEQVESQMAIIHLKRELNNAIEKEDYETAAQLRDDIEALEHKIALEHETGTPKK